MPELLIEGLEIAVAANVGARIPPLLDTSAGLAAWRGETETAALLAGAAQGLLQTAGMVMAAADVAFHDNYMARLLESLGEAECNAGFAEGMALSPESAVSAAIAWLRGPHNSHPAAPSTAPPRVAASC